MAPKKSIKRIYQGIVRLYPFLNIILCVNKIFFAFLTFFLSPIKFKIDIQHNKVGIWNEIWATKQVFKVENKNVTITIHSFISLEIMPLKRTNKTFRINLINIESKDKYSKENHKILRTFTCVSNKLVTSYFQEKTLNEKKNKSFSIWTFCLFEVLWMEMEEEMREERNLILSPRQHGCRFYVFKCDSNVQK